MQQERTDHERAIKQMAELRASNAELEDDVEELKKQVAARDATIAAAASKAATDSAVAAAATSSALAAKNDLAQFLSPRSGGSRVSRRGVSERPGAASEANRFSTLRDAKGTLRAGASAQIDLASEVQSLKAQRAELRDRLDAERLKFVDVLGLVRQLSIVVGVDGASNALTSANAMTSTATKSSNVSSAVTTTVATTASTSSSIANELSPRSGTIPASALGTTASARIGSVIYRRQQSAAHAQPPSGKPLAALAAANNVRAQATSTTTTTSTTSPPSPTMLTDTATRIRVTIDKIAEQQETALPNVWFFFSLFSFLFSQNYLEIDVSILNTTHGA